MAANLQGGLPTGFEIAMLTLESKIPFKILSYREALIHRFSDTFTSAVELIRELRPVSAALLTRGSLESLARIKELSSKLKRFLDVHDVAAIDKFLMNRLFGARNDEELPPAANILNSIDDMTDLIPNFEDVYDNLSEYCHPNYAGTFGSFVKIDRDVFYVDFEDAERRDRAMNTMLPALLGCYGTFEYPYNGMVEDIETINAHFDEGHE